MGMETNHVVEIKGQHYVQQLGSHTSEKFSNTFPPRLTNIDTENHSVLEALVVFEVRSRKAIVTPPLGI